MTALIETDLHRAIRHVAEADIRCTRQRALISRIRLQGNDPFLAEDLLDRFEDTLVRMRTYRDRLIRDVAP